MKPRTKPALYKRAKTENGWRYVKLQKNEQPKDEDRLFVRERLNGKQTYTLVTSDPVDALVDARRRASDQTWRTFHQKLEKKWRPLSDQASEYREHLTRTQKLEAAENARLVLGEFLPIVKNVRTAKHVTREHLLQYQEWLRAKKQSERTIDNKHTRVKAFLKHCGVDTRTLAQGLNVRVEKTLPTVYSQAEIDRMFAVANEYERVLLHLGLRLGLREQEMQHSEWTDIDRDHRTFRVQSKPKWDFYVKDSEERDVPIPADTLALLDAWHKKREHTTLMLGTGKEHKHPASHLLRVIKRVAKRAKLAGEFTLHKLRRSYATKLLQSNKIDLATVQHFMGHSDLASTTRYLRPAAAKDKLDAIDSIF